MGRNVRDHRAAKTTETYLMVFNVGMWSSGYIGKSGHWTAICEILEDGGMSTHGTDLKQQGDTLRC